MSPDLRTTPRRREEGGIAILLALVLLSIMAVAAFSVSGSALREVAITGNESTGQKAAEAADAAVDWVITWANPLSIYDATGTLRTDGTDMQKAVRTGMESLINAIDRADLQSDQTFTDPKPSDAAGTNYLDYGTVSKETGAMRIFIRSGDKDYAGSELFLNAPGSTNVKQASEVKQAFDVEIRYLGRPLGNRGSGYKAHQKGNLFMISSIGRANVGSTGVSYIARREALMDYLP